ncbi:MAG: hypothetical protein ACRDQ2_10490 [Gaiellales bacterium]
MNEQATDTRFVPPYVSLKTILALIERMEKEGVPRRIDRTFLVGMSGGYQTQVLNALRSLGLISGEDGKVTDTLIELVESPDGRKKLFAKILWDRYHEPTRMGEERATHGELVETFRRDYELTGETLDKAVNFFLQAAAYAELPLSPFFKRPRASAATKRRAARKKNAVSSSENPAEPVESSSPTHGNTYQVHVAGGTVTLTAHVDFLRMSRKERDFLFALVDQMRAFSEGQDEVEDEDVSGWCVRHLAAHLES